MRVVDIYARVSRASDKRDRSTAGQVADCREFLVERELQVGEVHIDSSKSAWNKKIVRPGWEALMLRLERGECDGVIIFELSRFTRRSAEGLRLLDVAENGLLVMDTENDYDLTKARDRKTFRDAISAAEFESDMISMRTKRGKRAKVRDNAEFNNASRPFGFEHGNIVPREDEAAELRAAAKKLLAGVSALAICADLNKRGVLTSLGNTWKPPSLREALLRPCNVGDVTYRGEILHVGKYQGIMDRDTYDQLVAMYTGRRRGRPIANIATGFVLCDSCMHPLNAHNLPRTTLRNPDGSAIKAYRCVKATGGCGQQVDWWDLDTLVRDTALEILCDPGHAAAIEARANQVDDELKKVTDKIAELEALATEMGERLGRGQINLKRHDAVVGPLDEQLVKLEAQRSALKSAAPTRAVRMSRATRATWERRWKAGDVQARRDIVRQAFGGAKLLLSPGPRLQPAFERCYFPVESDSQVAEG